MGATWLFEMRKCFCLERHLKFLQEYRKWRPGGMEGGIGDELLDLMGYLKDMVYPKTNKVYTEEDVVLESVPKNVSDLAKMSIMSIRKQQKSRSKHLYTKCMVCGTKIHISNEVCTKCGGMLWRGTPIDDRISMPYDGELN